uniref:Uncharacterized protein n=1 Tax=Globodera rostochiensis TaxID=31243 RepID=A0A914IAD4_GLORO
MKSNLWEISEFASCEQKEACPILTEMFYTKSFIIIAIMALIFAVQPFNCISVNEIPLKKEKMQQEISFIVGIMREQLKSGIFAKTPNIALEQMAKSMCQIKFDEFENVFHSILNENEAFPPFIKIATQFCAIIDTNEEGETFEQNAKFALKMLGQKTNLFREFSSLRNLIVEQLKKLEEAQQQQQKVPSALQKECQFGGRQQSLLLEQFQAFLEEFGQHLPEGLDKNAVEQLLAITARQQATTLSTLFELITRDLWTDDDDNKATIDVANSDDKIELFDEMYRRRGKRQIDPFSQLITFLFNLITFLFAHQGDAPLSLYIAFLAFLWLCKGVFWGRRF